MKKFFVLIFLIFFSVISLYAQKKNGDKQSKEGNYNFKDVKVVSPDKDTLKYKTLELRYSSEIDPAKDQVKKEGKNYLIFDKKNKAIAHFEKNKSSAGKHTIYYIYTANADKEPEVITYSTD